MKKAARIIGLVIVSIIAALYLFIIVGSIFDRESFSTDFESLGMAALSIFTIFSVLLAWIKIRLGVWFILGAGVLFTIFALVTAGSHYLMAVMAAGGPLILGGILILVGIQEKKVPG